MANKNKKTIKELLHAVGITDPQEQLAGRGDLQDEFAILKKSYFRCLLTSHPDKGGDPEEFRNVQTAFEVLREMFKKNSLTSFALAAGSNNGGVVNVDELLRDVGGMPTSASWECSWEYYYEAAEEAAPIYRVEPAKSGRSKCKRKGCESLIPKGAIRVGSIYKETGTYGRWHCVTCWRVPNKVWLGMPQEDDATSHQFAAALLQMDEVLLTGVSDLDEEELAAFVAQVMNKENWTRPTKARKKMLKPAPDEIVDLVYDVPASAAERPPEDVTELVPVERTRIHFVIPKPGVNGTDPTALEGKTVVMTGTFPELGGGSALELGKEKAKALIQSFGGRVTGSVSGKTDFLLVGKNPGMSKVSKARSRPKIQLIGLHALKEELDSGKRIEYDPDRPATLIGAFSTGFKNNGLVLQANQNELIHAAGLAPAALDSKPAAEAAKKKAPKKKKKKKKRAAALADGTKPAAKKRKAAPKKRKTASKKRKTPAGKKVINLLVDDAPKLPTFPVEDLTGS